MSNVFPRYRTLGAVVALGLAVLSAGVHADNGTESMMAIKRYLLSSPRSSETRLVTRTLDIMAPDEQELRDIVAERLYRAADSGLGEQDEDAVAWFAKSLGAVGDARYQDAIAYGARKFSSRKIVRELDAAKRGLIDRGNGVYAQGSIDLAAVRDQAQARIAANRHADDIQMTVNVLMGRSLQEIIAAFGMPDVIGSQEFLLNGALIVKARTDAVMAHYYGHGMVLFSWDLQKKVWVADKVWLDRVSKALPYSGSQPQFANILASADGKYFRVALIRARQTVIRDDALIALLRTRLLASLAETEPHEVAALEYVCTLLAMRDEPVNHATLETVMNQAVSEDLRDRAEDRLEQLVGKSPKPRAKKKAKPDESNNDEVSESSADM